MFNVIVRCSALDTTVALRHAFDVAWPDNHSTVKLSIRGPIGCCPNVSDVTGFERLILELQRAGLDYELVVSRSIAGQVKVVLGGLVGDYCQDS